MITRVGPNSGASAVVAAVADLEWTEISIESLTPSRDFNGLSADDPVDNVHSLQGSAFRDPPDAVLWLFGVPLDQNGDPIDIDFVGSVYFRIVLDTPPSDTSDHHFPVGLINPDFSEWVTAGLKFDAGPGPNRFRNTHTGVAIGGTGGNLVDGAIIVITRTPGTNGGWKVEVWNFDSTNDTIAGQLDAPVSHPDFTVVPELVVGHTRHTLASNAGPAEWRVWYAAANGVKDPATGLSTWSPT